MKAVLISIQPKWCELIASGKKTVEVRKSAPKLETPFKCYIYMTKSGNPSLEIHDKDGNSYAIEKNYRMAGKVIGEFVCDKVYEIFTYQESDNTIAAYSNGMDEDGLDFEKSTCLTEKQLIKYLNGAPKCAGCGWHISDLKIYDKPKELGGFKKGCNDMDDPMYGSYCGDCEKKCYLTSPPQSWRYVTV